MTRRGRLDVPVIGVAKPDWAVEELRARAPFSHDLASAKALNATLHQFFAEQQVFRIDHFLG